MKKRHEYDIFNALTMAYEDSSNPGTKRSYFAAEKAFNKMIRKNKDFNSYLYEFLLEARKRYTQAKKLEAADIKKYNGAASCDDYFYDVMRFGSSYAAILCIWESWRKNEFR